MPTSTRAYRKGNGETVGANIVRPCRLLRHNSSALRAPPLIEEVPEGRRSWQESASGKISKSIFFSVHLGRLGIDPYIIRLTKNYKLLSQPYGCQLSYNKDSPSVTYGDSSAQGTPFGRPKASSHRGGARRAEESAGVGRQKVRERTKQWKTNDHRCIPDIIVR